MFVCPVYDSPLENYKQYTLEVKNIFQSLSNTFQGLKMIYYNN